MLMALWNCTQQNPLLLYGCITLSFCNCQPLTCGTCHAALHSLSSLCRSLFACPLLHMHCASWTLKQVFATLLIGDPRRMCSNESQLVIYAIVLISQASFQHTHLPSRLKHVSGSHMLA